MKELTYKITLDIYECCLYFIVSDNMLSIVNRYESKYKIPITSGSYSGLAGEFNFKNYFVSIEKDSLNINCISHELFHITNRILNNRGIEDEEAKAWLCGYLSQKIFDFLKKSDIQL